MAQFKLQYRKTVGAITTQERMQQILGLNLFQYRKR